jgi:N-acetylmuramic acid 6-phosphate etherase
MSEEDAAPLAGGTSRFPQTPSTGPLARTGRSAAGSSYFGNRILRHVRRDLEDLAARSYTGVLHTFSENDLAYYRGTMRDIVTASHELGLTVQICPWGLGRTFGGEAESRWVTFHPDACQVLDDGRRVATGCLNQPAYRAFCRDWADAALECGTDYVFWDEPHWTVPAHVGIDDTARWACRCEACAERFGRPLPTELTDEVRAFREDSLVDFLCEMLAHVRARGGKNTICLLPLTEGPHGIRDWDAVASLPGLDVLATDPYWKNFDESAGSFVGRFSRLLYETASRHGVRAQLWLPSFGLTRDDIADLVAAVDAARDAGIDDLWTWGYEACAHMTHLATPDAPAVWEAVTAALTQSDGPASVATERHRVDLEDLDLRPTRELVRLLNDDEAEVAHAVARAEAEIASAVDAIVERLRDGGRLVYVGAGSSGRLAALDAAECEPTFSTAPGQVLALVAGGTDLAVANEDAEDDADAGVAAVREAGVGRSDAVVAVSAGGRTPYTVAALEEAARRGALTIAVVGTSGSELAALAQRGIVVETGPELIAGSTRLKAGTAQKLVLNTLSTVTMVKLGKTYGNLMVDVHASNEKLRARARRAVALATGARSEEVDAAMAAADGDAKVALVVLATGVDARAARDRLDTAGGVVRDALREMPDVVGRD